MLLSTKEIEVTRSETNFDKACDLADSLALMKFDIDEYGHSTLEGWQRNCCWIEVEFVTYLKLGESHIYKFIGRAMKCDED
jgi:hypothetical protein